MIYCIGDDNTYNNISTDMIDMLYCDTRHNNLYDMLGLHIVYELDSKWNISKTLSMMT